MSDVPWVSPSGRVAWCSECSGWGEWLELDKRKWTVMKCCPVCNGSGFWSIAENIKLDEETNER
jgi:hypothetical protein